MHMEEVYLHIIVTYICRDRERNIVYTEVWLSNVYDSTSFVASPMPPTPLKPYSAYKNHTKIQ